MPQYRPTGAMTGLQTEFQQLVQAAVYHADGLWGEATFDLFAPQLPQDHGFIVASGIDDAVDALLGMHFSEDDVEWLEAHPAFNGVPAPFFESLRKFQFNGDIWAVPEGSVAFAQEPLVQVRAPLHQACLLETPLTQVVSLSTGVSTRTARMVLAARGRPVIDMSVRRCSSPQTALQTARAAWVAGSHATTNASAARVLGIETWHLVSDTILAAYDDDLDAYEAYRQHFPDGCHVHLPENDTQRGMELLEPISDSIKTVRLDHKRLLNAAAELRQTMNRSGFEHTKILGCGSLDEHQIAEHLRLDSKVDLFGIDYAIAHESSADRLDLSYRIAELVQGAQPTPITRHWSSPWPGTKQVVRLSTMDKICLDIEASDIDWTDGKALLEPVVMEGRRVRDVSSLSQARKRCRTQLNQLTDAVRRLRAPEPWPVVPSKALAQLVRREMSREH